jgi:hypothetical protein
MQKKARLFFRAVEALVRRELDWRVVGLLGVPDPAD